mgnify:CR=1 FL=1
MSIKNTHYQIYIIVKLNLERAAAAALEIALQSYDLFMEKEQQSEPELGDSNKNNATWTGVE